MNSAFSLFCFNGLLNSGLYYKTLSGLCASIVNWNDRYATHRFCGT